MAAINRNDDLAGVSILRPDSDLPLGQIIPGSRYRVVAQIGRGGMGAVYEAEHIDLQKKVALKLLLASSARSPQRVAAFLHEARTASKIGSPYIADVTDFGELADGRVYFVMEYLPGRSVGQLLRAGEIFSHDRAIAILRQMTKALGATHDKGVIHLDVKPDNVMILHRHGRSDHVKMVDFGIAGLSDDARAGTKTISGTPEYVPPERIAARGYDNRSDIYSLGIVAYELFTGTLPFRGRDHVETLKLHLESPPPPLGERAPARQVPANIDRLVLQLLAKRPEDRPPTMADVEALLCEAQIASGITTTWDDLELPAVDDKWRVSLAERMPSPARRRTRAVTVGASIVAVLAAGSALYLGVIRQPRIAYKLVPVFTETQEPSSVAAYLVRADQAVRRQNYVTPVGDSALDFIERAEDEARLVAYPSRGPQLLRESYASNLAAMAAELESVAGLGDLALVKYREALRFLPRDRELQAKARLTESELAMYPDRKAWDARVNRGPEAPERMAQQLAADAFLAARRGRISEARLALRKLAQVDKDGRQGAMLADGLRQVAARSWDSGKVGEARPLYEVVAGLDPEDRSAARRAEAPPEPNAEAAVPAVASATETPPAKTPAPLQARRQGAAVPAFVDAKVARDVSASARAVSEGDGLLAKLRLRDAEDAFTRGLKLDPQNARAVAGLAHVSFERARYEEALGYARQAARLEPRKGQHRRVLGDAYFKLLRYREAEESYKQAQKLAPGDRVVAARLVELQEKLR